MSELANSDIGIGQFRMPESANCGPEPGSNRREPIRSPHPQALGHALANPDVGIGHFRMSELANSGIRIGQLRAPNTLAALPGSRAGCPAASLPPPIPASCRRPAGARLPAPNLSRTVPNQSVHRSQPILLTPHLPGREAPPAHRPRGRPEPVSNRTEPIHTFFPALGGGSGSIHRG